MGGLEAESNHAPLPMTFPSQDAPDTSSEEAHFVDGAPGDFAQLGPVTSSTPQYLSSSAPANLTSPNLDNRSTMPEEESETDDEQAGGVSLMEGAAGWEASGTIYTYGPEELVELPSHGLQPPPAQPSLLPPNATGPSEDPWVSVFEPIAQLAGSINLTPFAAVPVSENYFPIASEYSSFWDAWDSPAIPENLRFFDICKFVRELQAQSLRRADLPLVSRNLEDALVPRVITGNDLDGECCDMQGIDWASTDLSRAFIRAERNSRERTKLRLTREPLIMETTLESRDILPDSETFFSFRRMTTTHKVSVPHFQLRNLLTLTSRNDIYYAARDRVMHTSAFDTTATCVMKLSSDSFDYPNSSRITTLTSSPGILVAGGFEGEYALLSLSSPRNTPPTTGHVTQEHNGITNHVHLFSSRTSESPLAVFSSNDKKLRILDCASNKFIHSCAYETPVNCSATSPDRRLRVVVGDGMDSFITDAERGSILQQLPGHQDDVFACAWADDGIHVATGAQDHKVIVWDARFWARPVATIQSELSVSRSLRFSPVGGGPRVLFSAEADDFLSIIDATSFDKRQVVDFFGSIGGMTVTPDGSSLFVANTDAKFGGIMEFERESLGRRMEAQRGSNEAGRAWTAPDWLYEDDREAWQWLPEIDLDDDPRVVQSADQRRRRGVDLSSFVL